MYQFVIVSTLKSSWDIYLEQHVTSSKMTQYRQISSHFPDWYIFPGSMPPIPLLVWLIPAAAAAVHLSVRRERQWLVNLALLCPQACSLQRKHKYLAGNPMLHLCLYLPEAVQQCAPGTDTACVLWSRVLFVHHARSKQDWVKSIGIWMGLEHNTNR